MEVIIAGFAATYIPFVNAEEPALHVVLVKIAKKVFKSHWHLLRARVHQIIVEGFAVRQT